jgi:hypothetical protein
MERFGYTLKQAKKESSEILLLMEAESYGFKRDEKEEMEEQKAEHSRVAAKAGNH